MCFKSSVAVLIRPVINRDNLSAVVCDNADLHTVGDCRSQHIVTLRHHILKLVGYRNNSCILAFLTAEHKLLAGFIILRQNERPERRHITENISQKFIVNHTLITADKSVCKLRNTVPYSCQIKKL